MIKKIIVLCALSITTVFAKDTNEEMITNLSTTMGAGAGAGGLALIYATVFAPIGVFIILAGVVIGFYFNKFEQKDRGLWKTVAAVFMALIVGYIGHFMTQKVFDGMWDSSGCSAEISNKFFKAAGTTAIKPSTKFMDNFGVPTCLSSGSSSSSSSGGSTK